MTHHNRVLDGQRLAKAMDVLRPLLHRPFTRRSRVAASVAAEIEINQLHHRRHLGEAGLKPEWSKPGPPCSSNSVGTCLIAGPSGLSFDPSTSKYSFTSSTCIRMKPSCPRGLPSSLPS